MIALLTLLFFIIILTTRILFLIVNIRQQNYSFKRVKPVNTIICIGSGGHTTEMLKLIENLRPNKYQPRYYVMAKNDIVSEEKIVQLERDSFKYKSQYTIVRIPRSRMVNQSYFTSIFTTIKSIFVCIPIVFKIKPDLILCNGPGTCIPICVIAFLMRVCYLCDTKIVFIESICRVESLSLTGLILNCFADRVIVQWEELKQKYKRADYLGQLL